jgi:Cu-processing system ATP-binding protein
MTSLATRSEEPVVTRSEHAVQPMVLLEGVAKRFGSLEVLRSLDLAVTAGRVTGLVGPNGAGKSTLMKILLGLVRPDRGVVTIDGSRVADDPAYRQAIGYMPQAARFPENLTGAEVLRMLRDLRGNTAQTDPYLIGAFELEPHLDKPVRVLSGGTRQKLSAAIAFLFRPKLLILDEPTAGLDPVASGIFKDRLIQAREEGATQILASHSLGELEELADDIVFLLDGRVRFHGTINRLRQLTGLSRLERAIASLMVAGTP